MALNIKYAEADRLARELARATGETLTEAVVNALRERLARQRRTRPVPQRLAEIIHETQVRLARLPVLDPRSPDEMLGYDERGMPR